MEKDIHQITLEKLKEGKICPFEINAIVGSANIFQGRPNQSNVPVEDTQSSK